MALFNFLVSRAALPPQINAGCPPVVPGNPVISARPISAVQPCGQTNLLKDIHETRRRLLEASRCTPITGSPISTPGCLIVPFPVPRNFPSFFLSCQRTVLSQTCFPKAPLFSSPSPTLSDTSQNRVSQSTLQRGLSSAVTLHGQPLSPEPSPGTHPNLHSEKHPEQAPRSNCHSSARPTRQMMRVTKIVPDP